MPSRYTLIEFESIALPELTGFVAWIDAENNIFADEMGNLFGFGDPISAWAWRDEMGNLWRDDLGNIWTFETTVEPRAEGIYRVWIDAQGNVFIDPQGDTTVEIEDR